MTTKVLVTMDELLAGQVADNGQLVIGETVSGKVLSIRKHEILVDLGSFGIGFVPRREVGATKSLSEGDEVTASVVETELDSGYALLSLRKAAKDRGWDEVIRIMNEGESVTVITHDANRGGLLAELEGVSGFLPVSQLSPENYPRVNGNDKEEILSRLNGLIGKSFKVRVLDADRKTNKLIFSEKEATKEALAAHFKTLAIGDEVTGVATGVVDFGIFVNVSGIEGLVHISEISWERVNNPTDYVKVGGEVKAKIIAIDKDRLSLSMKQLTADPWLSEVKKFKVGDKVDGTVARITPFGAFVQLSPSVEALVHVSKLGSGDGADPEKVFTLNEHKNFTILEIDRENKKISLSLDGSKKK